MPFDVKLIVADMFQSTRPGGRDAASPTRSATSTVQSTRPGGARPARQNHQDRRRKVSIHAPRRGRRGRTACSPPGSHCFNPRAPAGRDPCRLRTGPPSTRFNPRAPAGARPVFDAFGHVEGFQSTRPGGGATAVGERPAGALGFNPRAPAGRASALLPRRHPVCVSIHAPRRGATRHDQRQRAVRRVSIPRPGGARPSRTSERPTRPARSIHAPRRGAT